MSKSPTAKARYAQRLAAQKALKDAKRLERIRQGAIHKEHRFAEYDHKQTQKTDGLDILAALLGIRR